MIRFPIGFRLGPALLAVWLGAYLAGCAAPHGAAPPVAQHQAYINNGTPEYGQDGVVLIVHQQGSACTGTIIGSRVIVTAKHCVVQMDQNGNAAGMLPVSGFGIFIGQHPQVGWSWNPDYTVSETRTTDGATITDNDIAVMITAQPMSETPYPVITSYPSDFVGSQVYLIGYGLDQCTGGQSGAKLRTTDQVVGWEGFNSFYTQGKGANSGDSGGPVFDENYRLVGVMVAVPQDPYSGQLQCGTTICTRLDHFHDLIQQALEDTGGCFPTGTEDVCGNNIDDDCNGLVDDGCNPLGAACGSDADCVSRFCAQVDGSSICAERCDPWNPTAGCPSGSYCKMVSCNQGACVPGSAGPKAAGELCGQDTDCQSLLCRAGADGQSYCALRCTLDAGECLPNEVCVAMGETCGACLLSTLSQGPRGIGEMCQLGQNCRSGLCINDAGAFYCSVPCQTDEGCPDGFHCREDRCVRGEVGAMGDPCVVNDDCAAGLVCHAAGDVAYCTEEGCGSCPEGFTCTESGSGTVCAADAAPVGARCSRGQDCLSGSCAVIEGQALCTEACNYGDPCPPGTFCTLADTGVLACAPNSLPPQTNTSTGDGPGKGGCRTAGDPSSGGLLLWLLGLGLWLRRRPRPWR